METKTAGMEEVIRLYKISKEHLWEIEQLEKKEGVNFPKLKEYQNGRIEGIEDVMKALGLYDEMMGIRKPTEEEKDLQEYMEEQESEYLAEEKALELEADRTAQWYNDNYESLY